MRSAPVQPLKLESVLIVGAGAIGRQIATQTALGGCDVILYDRDPSALEAAHTACRNALTDRVASGSVSFPAMAQALERIRLEAHPARAANVDLLIESVPEQLKIKRAVFAEFHTLCPPHTLFATNTSMLLPSMLAAATGRPAQFAALHFVMGSEIVEIMPHPGTSPQTLAAFRAFARQLNHLTITCQREQPGYLVNSMLMALNASALTLAVNGVAHFEDIDRAWMKALNVDKGPFGILDIVGLDTAWQITDYGARWVANPQTRKNADFLRQYVDAGRLGVKSGCGFYAYPDPAFRHPEFMSVPAVELPEMPVAAIVGMAAPAAF